MTMGLQTIHYEGDSTADSSKVWALLDNTRLWPTWTQIEEANIQEAGDSAGVGEVRTFTTGRVTVKERVIEKTTLVRYSYVLLGGLALRDYRAVIELNSAADAGTHITWHTTFKPRVPGSGWLYRRALAKATREFVAGLAAKAEVD